LLQERPLGRKGSSPHAIKSLVGRVVTSAADTAGHGWVDRVEGATKLVAVGAVVGVNDKRAGSGVKHGDRGNHATSLSAHHGVFHESANIFFVKVQRHHADSRLVASGQGSSGRGRVSSMLHNVGRIETIRRVGVLLEVTGVPGEFSTQLVVPQDHVSAVGCVVKRAEINGVAALVKSQRGHAIIVARGSTFEQTLTRSVVVSIVGRLGDSGSGGD
jgi:hypothetical protein